MRILITGGAGFIGANLALNLKRDYPDYEIICLDNLKRRGSELNVPRLIARNINFIHGDIRNKSDIENIKFDLLLECSAEPSVLAGYGGSPSYLLETNLIGTLNCLEEVRKNNAGIIFLSTSRVYSIKELTEINLIEDDKRFNLADNQRLSGISNQGINEKFSIDGTRSLYGATKLASELIIREYLEMYGLNGVINRCGVIAGPWQMGKVDQGFIALWAAKHIFGGNLAYIGFGGSGKQVRDVLHIEDLYDLIKIQINDIKKYSRQTFNVGGGIKNSISLLELTRLCKEISGREIEISKIQETRKADIPLYITDNSKITQLSGWFPKRELFRIVKDVFDWISKNKEDLGRIFQG